MNLELNEVQAEVLTRELHSVIQNDRYPLSPRIVALKEIGKTVIASRCWVANNAFARTQCGRKTTRAIRAVQMSAGDKDRSGFHRVGGSLTQAHLVQDVYKPKPPEEKETCFP